MRCVVNPDPPLDLTRLFFREAPIRAAGPAGPGGCREGPGADGGTPIPPSPAAPVPERRTAASARGRGSARPPQCGRRGAPTPSTPPPRRRPTPRIATPPRPGALAPASAPPGAGRRRRVPERRAIGEAAGGRPCPSPLRGALSRRRRRRQLRVEWHRQHEPAPSAGRGLGGRRRHGRAGRWPHSATEPAARCAVRQGSTRRGPGPEEPVVRLRRWRT